MKGTRKALHIEESALGRMFYQHNLVRTDVLTPAQKAVIGLRHAETGEIERTYEQIAAEMARLQKTLPVGEIPVTISGVQTSAANAYGSIRRYLNQQ